MSVSALQAARAALTAEVVALALTDVAVYGYEPPTVPGGTTVTVATGGITPTEWVLTLRVYVSDSQPGDAQNTLDDTVTAIDIGLSDVAPRPETWDFSYDEERRMFVATASVPIGREDF